MSPLPRAIPLPPTRGRLRGGPRVRARSAADHHPNHTQHRQRLGQKGAGHHSPSANISVIRGSDTLPPIHRSTPPPTTTCPLSREPFPSPSQGEIKRGSQGEGNRAAMGCGPPPKPPPPPSPQQPPPTTPPSFPSFPIIRIIVQLFSQFVPQFEIPLPPNSTLDTYLTFVLTLSLYKFLAPDRPIWATIKPDLTRGTRTIR